MNQWFNNVKSDLVTCWYKICRGYEICPGFYGNSIRTNYTTVEQIVRIIFVTLIVCSVLFLSFRFIRLFRSARPFVHDEVCPNTAAVCDAVGSHLTPGQIS